MAEARGFWKGDDLWWKIDGEEVSDKDLRRWVWHNIDGMMKYVDVIRQLHVDAYANRAR